MIPGSGLVVGRFLPPHQGHLTLIGAARALSASLTVVVVGHEGEPIPRARRRDWLAALVPDACVLTVERGDPETLLGLLGGPVARLFGASLGLGALAAALGAEAVAIDPERDAIPLRARAALADPAAHWRWLPGPVRLAFQKRVTLFGAESTGKSTLASRLAARFGGPHVPEHGRAFEHQRAPGPWSAAELEELARRHAAHRAALAPLAGPVLIEDTDALSTAVWGRMLGHPAPALEAAPLADLYLVADPNVPFVQDGIRYFEGKARARFDAEGRALLARRAARVATLSGGWAAREAAAVAAVEALMAEPFPPRA